MTSDSAIIAEEFQLAEDDEDAVFADISEMVEFTEIAEIAKIHGVAR